MNVVVVQSRARTGLHHIVHLLDRDCLLVSAHNKQRDLLNHDGPNLLKFTKTRDLIERVTTMMHDWNLRGH